MKSLLCLMNRSRSPRVLPWLLSARWPDTMASTSKLLCTSAKTERDDLILDRQVLVEGLSPKFNLRLLKLWAKSFGKVTHAQLILPNSESSPATKTGFVLFRRPEDAARAIREANGAELSQGFKATLSRYPTVFELPWNADKALMQTEAEIPLQKEITKAMHIGHLSADEAERELVIKHFRGHPDISSVQIVKNHEGGYQVQVIEFFNIEQAKKAVASFPHESIRPKFLFVPVSDIAGLRSHGRLIKNTLYILNLPYNLTAQQLYEQLEAKSIENLKETEINLRQGKSLGSGSILFHSAIDSAIALSTIESLHFDGRKIVVLEKFKL